MENYCISVDWLQTYCLGNEITIGEYQSKTFKFIVQLQEGETAQFRSIYHVSVGGMQVAVIQQRPRTKVINQKATLVKLSNRVLYSQLYIRMLYELQEVLSLTYKGITRIDICYDCNRFAGGRSVPRFIKHFVEKPLGEKGSLYRRGSDKFAAYGSKSSTSNARISSIRFGSENSRIGCYIYDKTLELKEVKDKPWIRETWEQNGLISDDKTHVWRSEISIKAEGTDLLNMTTGELFKISPEYLEHIGSIQNLFYVYAGKMFDFRICNGQECKRNYDKLLIFECDKKITEKPYYVSQSADTGRMEKICYNKLQKLSREYLNLSEPIRYGLQTAMDFLDSLSGKKLSKINQEHYKQYLNNFYAMKNVYHEDRLYLEALDSAFRAKRDIDAESYYLHMYELPALVMAQQKFEYTKECFASLIDEIGFIP